MTLELLLSDFKACIIFKRTYFLLSIIKLRDNITKEIIVIIVITTEFLKTFFCGVDDIDSVLEVNDF